MPKERGKTHKAVEVRRKKKKDLLAGFYS